MAWVMSLVSASSRTMSGWCWLSEIFAGAAFAAAWAAWSLRRAASTGASSLASIALVITVAVPGDGAAQRVQLALPGGFCFGEVLLRGLDGGGGGLLRRVGDHPLRVVRGDRVGVQGVEGEVRAGVPEVVLLPPPAGHPVDHGRRRQAGGVTGGEDVHLAVLVAAGDLPQREHFSLVLPGGDRQLDAGSGHVVLAGAAVIAGECGYRERVTGQVRDVLAGAGLAVGEQVKALIDDGGEQVRGPAAPVRAQHRLGPVSGDGPQVRRQVLDPGGQ